MNHIKELLEFEGGSFLGEDGDKLLGHQIGKPAREGAFSLHNRKA
jgi:hypothetical protein